MNPQTLTELLVRRVAAGGVAIIDRDKFIYPAALDLESKRVAQGLHFRAPLQRLPGGIEKLSWVKVNQRRPAGGTY